MIGSYERYLNPSLHIGFEDGQVVVDVILENTSDEDLKASGRWVQINIVDDEGRPRLESMATTCVVKQWEIDAGKSIRRQRRSETPQMVRDDMDEYEGALTFTPNRDEEDRDNRVYYMENIDPEAESEDRFTASAKITLGEYSITLEKSFTLSELEAPDDIDSLYSVMDNPRVSMSPVGLEATGNPNSVSFTSPPDDPDSGHYSEKE